jgi:hypothetical protein
MAGTSSLFRSLKSKILFLSSCCFLGGVTPARKMRSSHDPPQPGGRGEINPSLSRIAALLAAMRQVAADSKALFALA